MNTENLSTLKIHKLTEAQYQRELAAGNIDANAIYLTPDEAVQQENATQSADGLMSKEDKAKLDNISESADAVSFSRTLTSGAKVGTITINGTGTDLYAPAGYTHPNNHPASMITGLATVATSGNYNDLTNKPTIPSAYTHPTYTARTGKPTANQTPAFGGTATVSQITSDGTGHVTGATDRTIKIPDTLSNGTGTAGLIKTSSTVTSNSGYTASPVINGVPYYKDTDTHYASDIVVGDTADCKQHQGTAITNGNVYLNHKENGLVTSSRKITGSGAATVTTDASGNIVISSTDSNTSHSHSAGVGLTGSGNAGTSGTYTYKAKLRSETALTVDSTAATTTSGRVYPVAVDKTGYLAVNVPWTDTNTHAVSSVNSKTGAVVLTASDVGAAESSHTHSSYVNQNAFSKVKVGSTTVTADTTTDTLEIVAGSNVTITPDATNDKITIAATDTTYNIATASANGLMAAADKSQLLNGGIPIISISASTAGQYTGTLSGVTTLTKGMKITVVPTSGYTGQYPTLNLNGLGAKSIYAELMPGTASAFPEGVYFLTQGDPITLMYDGSCWVYTDFKKVRVETLYGDLITIDDIDEICGGDIYSASEVTY